MPKFQIFFALFILCSALSAYHGKVLNQMTEKKHYNFDVIDKMETLRHGNTIYLLILDREGKQIRHEVDAVTYSMTPKDKIICMDMNKQKVEEVPGYQWTVFLLIVSSFSAVVFLIRALIDLDGGLGPDTEL